MSNLNIKRKSKINNRLCNNFISNTTSFKEQAFNIDNKINKLIEKNKSCYNLFCCESNLSNLYKNLSNSNSFKNNIRIAVIKKFNNNNYNFNFINNKDDDIFINTKLLTLKNKKLEYSTIANIDSCPVLYIKDLIINKKINDIKSLIYNSFLKKNKNNRNLKIIGRINNDNVNITSFINYNCNIFWEDYKNHLLDTVNNSVKFIFNEKTIKFDNYFQNKIILDNFLDILLLPNLSISHLCIDKKNRFTFINHNKSILSKIYIQKDKDRYHLQNNYTDLLKCQYKYYTNLNKSINYDNIVSNLNLKLSFKVKTIKKFIFKKSNKNNLFNNLSINYLPNILLYNNLKSQCDCYVDNHNKKNFLKYNLEFNENIKSNKINVINNNNTFDNKSFTLTKTNKFNLFINKNFTINKLLPTRNKYIFNSNINNTKLNKNFFLNNLPTLNIIKHDNLYKNSKIISSKNNSDLNSNNSIYISEKFIILNKINIINLINLFSSKLYCNLSVTDRNHLKFKILKLQSLINSNFYVFEIKNCFTLSIDVIISNKEILKFIDLSCLNENNYYDILDEEYYNLEINQYKYNKLHVILINNLENILNTNIYHDLKKQFHNSKKCEFILFQKNIDIYDYLYKYFENICTNNLLHTSFDNYVNTKHVLECINNLNKDEELKIFNKLNNINCLNIFDIINN